ncbi:MAG TPA: AarF/UbiB family protein [Rhodanobacteraceae bacterium]|nr:AarF/UbiB family protein [Rhodanobacteraceae bacterium]
MLLDSSDHPWWTVRGAASRRRSPLGRLRRFVQVARFCLRHAALIAPLAKARPRAGGADAFARELQALGPAFVKIGQTLSTRPDLLAPDYLAALARLQDDVTPVAFDAVRAVIETELGLRLDEAFLEIDERPLAAASLAQVHAAITRDGDDVVVKIQRPDIRVAVEDDLAMLHALASLADRFTEQGRRVRFVNWVEQMGETLAEELDYEIEADNLRVFARNLAAHPCLMVPRTYPALSARRVLTMERVHGVKVSEPAIATDTAGETDRCAAELIRAYLEQIFVQGLVHADPHPGNVLLENGGRIALVDLGMVARLTPQMRTSLLKLLCAAVQGDGDQVADIAATIGERLAMFDEATWRRRCGKVVGRYATQSDEAVYSEGVLMMDLTRLATECGLRAPAEIALLGKTLLNLDNVCRTIDPHVPVRRIVRDHAGALARMRSRKSLNPAALAAEAVEVVDLAADLPRQIHEILELAAHNRFRVRISGLEESRLLENLQKIANRISAGTICAALIIGAALALRIDAGARLFGYPALALLLFLGAFLLGSSVVIVAMLTDRRMSRYKGRGK